MRLARATLLALTACQPYRPTLATPCRDEAPDAVTVGPVGCTEAIPAEGEGRSVDTLLAAPRFAAVIRAPTASLTLPGVGGGTVVDIAPWGLADAVHEIVPTVSGGALRPDRFDEGEDGVVVEGPVVRLPGGPAVDEGARGRVRWGVDGSWLVAEGAETLRVHLRGDVVARDGRYQVGAVVMTPGGPVRDLGGVLEVLGDRVAFAPAADVGAWASTPTRPASGRTSGDALAWRRDGEVVARFDTTGTFRVDVPDDWTDVRAEAAGRAPGGWTPIGTELDLEVGGGGTLVLQADTAVVARFRGPSEVGPVRVDPTGATLPLGAGDWTLTVTGGPERVPRTLAITLVADTSLTVDVSLTRRFDPGAAVLVAAPWPTDRDRAWRGSSRTARLDAAAAGVDYVVLAPRDEVGGATEDDDPGGPWWENGAWLTNEAWGSVVGWPWTPSSRLAGHGAPATGPLGPEGALAAAWGGPGTDRYTAVDLAWLAAVATPPAAVQPRPDIVWLDDPDDDPAAAWRPWWRWLDAGVPLVPLGPFAWAPVLDPDLFGPVDVERALVEDRWVATTGPRLDLRVGDAQPGQIAPFGEVRVAVSGGLNHVWLITEGGRVVADAPIGRETASYARPAGAWVVAVATGPDGAWAATAPVWLRRRP